MNITDTIEKLIPNEWAARALSGSLWLAGGSLTLSVFPPDLTASIAPYIPDWLKQWQARVLLAEGILLLGSYAAFVLMVRAYRKLQRDHAAELERLAAKPPAAGVQSAGLTTRRTRGQLLGDDPS